MATVVSNSEYAIAQGTSCGKVQCCHGNHINYRILLKLINAARQAAAFSQRLTVAFGYGGFKKNPEAIGLKGRAGL